VCTSLKHFDWINFKAVLTLINLDYFIEKFVFETPSFKMGILQNFAGQLKKIDVLCKNTI
jgi:hypothetical protein